MRLKLHAIAVHGLAAAAASALGALSPGIAAAWEPTKTIEFVIPAGTGGGADQMARMIQGIVQKYDLAPVSMVVVNKSGGAGAEGFMDVVESKGNDHKIIITLSNLFTTPLATGVPFSWEDMTPVAMLALDNFILWVNAESPYKTAVEYIDAVKAGQPNQFKMAGTGSKQEDQIITAAIEQGVGVTFTYVPFKGGGDVAAQLVGGHVDSTVNNPIEQVSHWQAGKTRGLCVFAAERLQVEGDIPWGDIPSCKEAGLAIEYQMLRGIFMPADVSQEVVDY
jgi:tripartite-type tricarboxylate transporter receptor subunit TctC